MTTLWVALGGASGNERGIIVEGLWFELDCEAGFESKDVMDNGGSIARASCIDGKECRCDDGNSLSSSFGAIFERESVGEIYPPWLMTELVVENEYGGGGPEYIFDGLMGGGAGMFKVVETGILGW